MKGLPVALVVLRMVDALAAAEAQLRFAARLRDGPVRLHGDGGFA